MEILSRRKYDVRFLKIPGKGGRPDKKAEELIHKIYPGNHGQYRCFTQSLWGDNYITIIIKQDVLDACEVKNISLPSLLLPEILKKAGKRITEDLVIWYGDAGEIIHFDKEGTPVSNRLITSRPETNTKWIWAGSDPKERQSHPVLRLVPESDFIFNRPLSLKNSRLNLNQSFDRTKPLRRLPFLFVLLLTAVLLGLFRFTALQRSEIEKLKRQVTVSQQAILEYKTLKDEISVYREQLAKKELRTGPYKILSDLALAAPSDLQIDRLTLERNSFSLDGRCSDPILFSGTLSEASVFSGVNISRIRKIDDEFTFTLMGVYSEP